LVRTPEPQAAIDVDCVALLVWNVGLMPDYTVTLIESLDATLDSMHVVHEADNSRRCMAHAMFETKICTVSFGLGGYVADIA
jgi:hypothetical protein